MGQGGGEDIFLLEGFWENRDHWKDMWPGLYVATVGGLGRPTIPYLSPSLALQTNTFFSPTSNLPTQTIHRLFCCARCACSTVTGWYLFWYIDFFLTFCNTWNSVIWMSPRQFKFQFNGLYFNLFALIFKYNYCFLLFLSRCQFGCFSK